ncbi:hypothetical protein ACGFSB_06610 [Streptomyces sp. NPDC048441]|uniref:hypothetical protein n=1 Tax=Streptomyces sp. NPDC048441 TaxID=3365552 RepID=UPI00371660CA
MFDRTDLTPRERLLAAFDIPPPPLCAPTSPPPSNFTTPSNRHPRPYSNEKGRPVGEDAIRAALATATR